MQNKLNRLGIDPEELVDVECKHVVYTKDGQGNDLLTIKEVYHLQGGKRVTNVTHVENFRRPFYITLPQYQNHKDKKEWEETRFLRKYMTTQSNLTESIVRAQGWGRPSSLRRLARSQYLYGCDIGTPALVKHRYQQRWPNGFRPNTIAVMDTETDMLAGDDSIIVCSITMKDKALITIRSDFVRHVGDVEAAIMRHCNDRPEIRKILEERKIQLDIRVYDTDTEMVVACVEELHVWRPDFVTFWNMDFDMNRMLEALVNRGGFTGEDLANLFSDPSVPPRYRHFHYKRDNPLKKKDDGSFENKASYDMWNVVETPASFFMICSMCTYRRIRLAAGKQASYGLEYTSQRHLKMGKLYDDLEGVTAVDGTAQWHIQMQRHQQIPYVVYNLFDDIVVELLDEKTLDLNTQISILSKMSEYTIFNSNPRKTADDLHFFVQTRGHIVGSCSDQMEDDNDKLLPGKDGLILTLPCHTMEDNGLPMLKELPGIRSMLRMFVSDADIVSTYPNGERIMNLSKATTMAELCRIKGISLSKQILLGVNLTGGPVNAIKILHETCGLPSAREMLDLYKQHKKETVTH